MLTIACTFIIEETGRKPRAVHVKPEVIVSDPRNAVYTFAMQAPSPAIETLGLSIFIET